MLDNVFVKYYIATLFFSCSSLGIVLYSIVCVCFYLSVYQCLTLKTHLLLFVLALCQQMQLLETQPAQ